MLKFMQDFLQTDGGGEVSPSSKAKSSQSESSSESSIAAGDSSSSDSVSSEGIMQSGSDFINKGKENQVISIEDIQKNLLPIANIIVYIATGVFLVVGAILGIKYMLAPDANERAKIKSNLIWFVIAMFIVYGGVGIYNIVIRTLNGIF